MFIPIYNEIYNQKYSYHSKLDQHQSGNGKRSEAEPQIFFHFQTSLIKNIKRPRHLCTAAHILHRLDTINSSIYLFFFKSFTNLFTIVQKAERLFCTVKSDQFLQIFISCFSFCLILSKQSSSLFRILTFQRVVTNLAVKECLIIFHARSFRIK